MAKRRMAVTIILCLCFLLTPCYAMAASTTDASEPINVNAECTLTLSYTCNGKAFDDVSVKLYKVADVSSDFQYKLTSPFEKSALILNGVRTNGEWNVIRSTLEAHIVAENIAADAIAKADSKGIVCFEDLKPGLYLAVVGTVTQKDITCFFDSALVALPGLNTEGVPQYQVTVASKSELIPPSDDEIELKVLKLWKGDGGSSARPTMIEIEIFRNGISYQTATLSENNHWTYTWSTKDDGSDWKVVERNIPTGYTMTIEERETSFVLTNTLNRDVPDNPDSSETGDTSNIMLWVLLMIVSGSMLIILGIKGKRKRV